MHSWRWINGGDAAKGATVIIPTTSSMNKFGQKTSPGRAIRTFFCTRCGIGTTIQQSSADPFYGRFLNHLIHDMTGDCASLKALLDSHEFDFDLVEETNTYAHQVSLIDGMVPFSLEVTSKHRCKHCHVSAYQFTYILTKTHARCLGLKSGVKWLHGDYTVVERYATLSNYHKSCQALRMRKALG